MIASGHKHSKTKGSVLLATDVNSKTPYYWIPNREYPEIASKHDDLMQMLDSDWLLGIFRKYSLKQKDISSLIDFFKKSNTDTSLEIGDSWKLRQAFNAVEKRLLEKMKSCMVDNSLNLEPFHEKSFRTIAAIGPSNSGKTYQLVSILLREEFRKRKVYIFTPNPDDKSLLRLKQRPKSKNVWIDLMKVQRSLRLSDFDVDSIIFVDDIWDSEMRGKGGLRKIMLNLCDEVMVRGRHHASKGGPGTSLMLTTHVLSSKGMDKQILYTEAQNLYLYPSASPHTISHFLHSKIGLHRSDIKELLKISKGSRYIMIYNNKPICAIFKNGICLL